MIPVAALCTLSLLATQPQNRTMVNSSRDFVIPQWRYAPGYVVLSKDGTALGALSIGEGSTLYSAWDTASGRLITRGEMHVDPIHRKGGCFAGDESSAKHPPLSPPTWESPSSPIFVWNIGQQVDLRSKTQTPILQHPGWDAWESFAIVPGWSLSNLEVRTLNSTSPQPVVHWVEWNAPRTNQQTPNPVPVLKRFMSWSTFRRKSIECLSADGRWIALASPSDPDFALKDIKSIVSELGPVLQVRLWSVGSPLPVRSLALRKPATSMELSPHGHYLLATDASKECDVIDATTGIAIGTFGEHSSRVYWSENEEQLYTVELLNRTVRRYQLSPFRLDAVFQLSCVNERGFENILVDPDRKLAVGWYLSGSEDNVLTTTLQLFELRNPSPPSPSN